MQTRLARTQDAPEWTDLRYLLAVARAGSLLAAAKTLGVDQSTVGRRISALEESLGGALMRRLRTGIELTPLARELLPAIETMEGAAYELQRRSAGRDDRIAGRVSLATTEAFATHVLAPYLPELHALYPELDLDLLTGNEVVD